MHERTRPNHTDGTGTAAGPSWWSRFQSWFLDSGTDTAGLAPEPVELPWRHRWDHLPKRTAGFGFSQREYQDARRRAEVVARSTLGEALWKQLKRQGFLDLPSRVHPGLTYRLRVGRRIEVRCAPGVRSPWRHSYLCINPTYPLPEAEFFAHLYLYVRDREEEILRVAAPQPWDQALGRTF